MAVHGKSFHPRFHLPTSSGFTVFSCSGAFLSSSFESRRSGSASAGGGGDRIVVSSSTSAILCRFSVGTDTEDVLRRLRPIGAYLSMERRLFLSLVRLGLRLCERSRLGLTLRVRVRPLLRSLRLLLLLLLGLRRLRSSDRSLLRLKRRSSSRVSRPLPTSARVSLLSALES